MDSGLRNKRIEYNEAYVHEMTGPDGSWIEGYSPSDQPLRTLSKGDAPAHELETNNPLSLDLGVGFIFVVELSRLIIYLEPLEILLLLS